jgi:GT2 family glycosyltransferase
MRRSAFEQVGLFSETLLFDEDADWMMRARRKGFALHFHPPAQVWHRSQRQTFTAVMAHARVWGSYSIITRHRYPDLQPLPLVLRRWWSLTLVSPLVAAAVTARICARSCRTWRHVKALPAIVLAKMAWCWGAAQRLRQGDDTERTEAPGLTLEEEQTDDVETDQACAN